MITRSDLPQVVDLADWRRRYHAARAVENGQPVPRVIESPQSLLRRRESVIVQAINDHCAHRQIDARTRAAATACALAAFRNGCSVAMAIARGKRRATDLAWGEPEGAA